jgi:leucyl aminopeptidase
MHSLLGVGQGSVKESQLGIMTWNGGKAGDDPVILVGKGVCFDTGGISLKPGAGMEDMRGDMGGAAAVTGAMRALAERKAKVNVVGLVGLVENMPDGDAIRPGDILTSASGQTIEVQNTDAEGRLVLCDVLWYAQEHYKPRAMVDLATLTGAIVISLGHHHAGMFTESDALAKELTAAGLDEGERVWRLPLGPEYDTLIKSKFADMRNIGGRAAGSITAAQFLKRFINEGVKWAHLDIAGVAWVDGEKAPTDPSWASGFGPRLLDRWIAENYE